ARDSQRIVNIADQRLIVIRPFSDVDEQAQALVAVAQVVAEAGHPDQALAIARSIPDPNRQAQAPGAGAKVVAAGEWQRAGDSDRSSPDLDVQALALAGVAGVIAAAGDQERAVSIAEQLETIGHSVTQALMAVANAVAATGDPERAVIIARSIANPY